MVKSRYWMSSFNINHKWFSLIKFSDIIKVNYFLRKRRGRNDQFTGEGCLVEGI
jgi:hypothetical protein